MKTFEILFRYVPPRDYMTPRMYLHTEGTRISAESEEDAREQFFVRWDISARQRDYYIIERIEEC